jgi:hypothetical protein
MEFINSTRMLAGYTMGVEPNGRESLVVVVKGTFRIPVAGEPVRLADEQMPLVFSDVFFGEPGRSAPRYESEFAPRKRRCDLLMDGTAYAPAGRPTTRTQASIGIDTWSKTLTVIGDRSWQVGSRGITASSPVPFTTMPINYDRAFGGTDDKPEDPSKHAAFAQNPSGRGFHKNVRKEWIEGAPLPNTEEDGRPVTTVDGAYRPMAFGPIGRHWEPRSRYAGTYDDRWLEEHFPFLPPDFDEQYYQSAPLDQQIPIPVGGEEIILVNLTPSGRIQFTLPAFDAPIHFFRRDGEREDGTLSLDTIHIEPDHQRLSLVWRATRPLKKNLFEVAQTMVGKRSQAWWAQRDTIAFPIPLTLVTSDWDTIYPAAE